MSDVITIFDFDQRNHRGNGHCGWAIHGEDFVKFYRTYCSPQCGINDEILLFEKVGKKIIVSGYNEGGDKFKESITSATIEQIIELVEKNEEELEGYHLGYILNYIREALDPS